MDPSPSVWTTSRMVLILVAEIESFGNYTAEILKAEGINSFQTASLAGLKQELIAEFPVVVLNKVRIESWQADILRDYVAEGGCLIAFRPDPLLDDVFGIRSTDALLENGYLHIETGNQIGTGLTAEPLQFHGQAGGYHLDGAIAVAYISRSVKSKMEYPAVTSHSFGKGRSIAFTYNLPQSIVYTRQGNPAWAGQERDGILGIRAAEMFLGWNDPNRNHLNQADEQMRLLSNSIDYLGELHSPLPRLWYFPGFHRCLVILTDDGEDSSEDEFEAHISDIESAGGRLTLYLKDTYIPAKTVARWTSRGHEIAAHFDDTREAEHPTFSGMSAVARSAMENHRRTYKNSPISVRNHWIVWVGWSEQAEIEANLGIRMDCNTYHYDLGSACGRFLGNPGNFNGSGLPMKFASSQGEVVDIYQSITQLPDEQWLEAQLFSSFKTLVDRSLDNEGYSYLNVNFHTDRWQAWSKKPGLEMLDYANKRSVPIWTAAQTIDFLTEKDAASFENFAWKEGDLSFDLHTTKGNQPLTVMLPQSFDHHALMRVQINQITQSWLEMTFKGRAVVLVTTDGNGPFHISASYR